MKNNLTQILSILTISLISYACQDNNEHFSESIMQLEITESEFFSVAYNYSDTIRLTFDGQGYADIVVSSDKKTVLESHLSKYEYYLVKDEFIQEKEDQIDKEQNNMFFNITKCDISEIPKIGIEIIGTGGNNNEFDIRCRPRKTSSLSLMQKVIVYPYPSYYEYTSKVHDYYGKVKHTNYASNGDNIPPTLVRYGFKKCMLCKIITWPNGQWRVLSESYGYNYDKNAFGYDGSHYEGDNIYRLYTGVRSYSPDNFWVRFSGNPISDW